MIGRVPWTHLRRRKLTFFYLNKSLENPRQAKESTAVYEPAGICPVHLRPFLILSPFSSRGFFKGRLRITSWPFCNKIQVTLWLLLFEFTMLYHSPLAFDFELYSLIPCCVQAHFHVTECSRSCEGVGIGRMAQSVGKMQRDETTCCGWGLFCMLVVWASCVVVFMLWAQTTWQLSWPSARFLVAFGVWLNLLALSFGVWQCVWAIFFHRRRPTACKFGQSDFRFDGNPFTEHSPFESSKCEQTQDDLKPSLRTIYMRA